MRNKLIELLEIQEVKRLAKEMVYLEILVFWKFIVHVFS